MISFEKLGFHQIMNGTNRTMNKDNVNKIFGISFISLITIVIFSYISGNESVYGLANLVMLYGAIPLFLVWFGTRKRGAVAVIRIEDFRERN